MCVRFGADAELLGQDVAVEQPEDRLGVPDVDREQHARSGSVPRQDDGLEPFRARRTGGASSPRREHGAREHEPNPTPMPMRETLAEDATPSTAATAGFTYVITVARTGPTVGDQREEAARTPAPCRRRASATTDERRPRPRPAVRARRDGATGA